jgi:large conductance mechanosensitive channel
MRGHTVLKGFKDFIMRGNVVDLAVAVAIGAAFTALVAAMTKAVIEPLINLVLGGGVDGGKFTVNGQVFDIGLLINAIITFLITAVIVYFVVVVPMNKARSRFAKPTEEELTETEIDVLKQIRDSLSKPE